MAIRREAPNGVIVKFKKDGTTRFITEYLQETSFNQSQIKSSDKDRNFLTDVPLQAVGGCLTLLIVQLVS